MSQPAMITVDANEAVAAVAHGLTEMAVIYPITPSSPMGESVDQWASRGRLNVWGNVPEVVEMQSEAGAAGAVHGALQAGTMATTFTASQGLLLMIPNMYKIAGELLPFVMHVAARTLATHALSIFGDHGDVMACRQTGFTMLCSNSVQEAQDLAAISHAATLRTRIPVMHFFDGFRTSHEVGKISPLTNEQLKAMVSDELIQRFRDRALTPDKPVIRGTAQNPDTFFQARESCNGFYDACPGIVQEVMDQFAQISGRQYHLYDYEGAADAEQVIIIMGSGAETVASTVATLNAGGAKTGVLKVRLYRPFALDAFMAALPVTTKAIAVLDRTKEPGALGEPLYMDVITALRRASETGICRLQQDPVVVGGRYGLSSKEFTPAMVMGVFDELGKDKPKHGFTVGILDDITKLSLPWDPQVNIEPATTFRGIFYGLGADGTVGANKNSIKIIGEETDNWAQGYFVYDSKKSGAMTVSHLRFGPEPIRSPYLIERANFVGCHQFVFLDRFDVLEKAENGAVFLLNAPFAADQVWDQLPREMQQQIIDKNLKFYSIDALRVANDAGMGGRINTIMQTCFFAISGILPREEAIARIKDSIKKTYGKKGNAVVESNCAAVDTTLANLHEIKVTGQPMSRIERPPLVPAQAPDFVQRVTARILAGQGDLLPVSAFPVDGTWPTDTCQWEKRGIASEIPIWDQTVCIQCNKCALICPHAAIRAKAFDPSENHAPDTFKTVPYKAKDLAGLNYTIQVAPDDCTGCNLCVMVCPAKNKAEPRLKAINMEPRMPHLDAERRNYDYFLGLPELAREKVVRIDAKGSQFFEPMFEYSGACAGCGETPYVKLLTQLTGDRLIVANATGCSSIYGGNLPTTPYTVNNDGRGPAWCNSLFEDNAEFGYGIRLATEVRMRRAKYLLTNLAGQVGDELVATLLATKTAATSESIDGNVPALRQAVIALREKLKGINSPEAKELNSMADALVPKALWILGGDGWAYDIGFGGLDHVIAQPRDINILVMDTEVYSNTGGQASKATPLGAAAKFASSGKTVHKKDLGLMAMSYGHVYVASVAMGANDNQTVKAFIEAQSYDGPSLIIAYSHCVAHGYDLKYGVEQQKLAVSSGIWPLYRFDPRRAAAGEPPLQLDSPPIKAKVRDYMMNETRFRMVEKIDPQLFARLTEQAEFEARSRVEHYKQLSQVRTVYIPPVTLAVTADA